MDKLLTLLLPIIFSPFIGAAALALGKLLEERLTRQSISNARERYKLLLEYHNSDQSSSRERLLARAELRRIARLCSHSRYQALIIKWKTRQLIYLKNGLLTRGTFLELEDVFNYPKEVWIIFGGSGLAIFLLVFSAPGTDAWRVLRHCKLYGSPITEIVPFTMVLTALICNIWAYRYILWQKWRKAVAHRSCAIQRSHLLPEDPKSSKPIVQRINSFTLEQDNIANTSHLYEPAKPSLFRGMLALGLAGTTLALIVLHMIFSIRHVCL